MVSWYTMSLNGMVYSMENEKSKTSSQAALLFEGVCCSFCLRQVSRSVYLYYIQIYIYIYMCI